MIVGLFTHKSFLSVFQRKSLKNLLLFRKDAFRTPKAQRIMKNTLKISALLILALCMLASCASKKTTEPSTPSQDAPSESTSIANSSKNGENENLSDPFSMHLNTVSGKAGEEIVVSLEMVNNPSIAGYSVTVVYDPSVLSFVKCENKVGGFAVSNSATEGKVRVMCTVMGGNVLDHNGVCDELTFKINDSATGSTELQLLLADASDSIYKIEGDTLPSVKCTLTGCTVTITE